MVNIIIAKYRIQPNLPLFFFFFRNIVNPSERGIGNLISNLEGRRLEVDSFIPFLKINHNLFNFFKFYFTKLNFEIRIIN
jgi:hypothetical protein